MPIFWERQSITRIKCYKKELVWQDYIVFFILFYYFILFYFILLYFTLLYFILFYFILFYLSFCLFRATPSAYRGSQARGRIRAEATRLHHSYSNR